MTSLGICAWSNHFQAKFSIVYSYRFRNGCFTTFRHVLTRCYIREKFSKNEREIISLETPTLNKKSKRAKTLFFSSQRYSLVWDEGKHIQIYLVMVYYERDSMLRLFSVSQLDKTAV